MLIFLAERLAYLATPKTGSTAVEQALKRRADIVFARNRKHLPAQRYKSKVLPFLEETFRVTPESVAVMREPTDQLRSWYRYRMREEKTGAPQSTRGLSFDDFVLAVISENPPEFARVGSQFSFLTSGKGRLQADHLFAWEEQAQFLRFLEMRLDENIILEKRNVSPAVPAELSPDVEANLRAARAPDYRLFEKLRGAGGYISRAHDPAA